MLSKLFTHSGRLYLVALSLAVIVGSGVFVAIYWPRIDDAEAADRVAEVGES